MNASTQEKIRMLLNLELAKRLLVRYFIQRGFAESFDKHVYPPTVASLPKDIPQFIGKVEIIPFVEEIDPMSGTVKVGWNLFVLGTNRLYLGNSMHRNVAEVKAAADAPTSSNNGSSSRLASPRKIIKFILETLKDKKHGFIDPQQQTPLAKAPTRAGAVSSFMFYQKNKPV